MVILERVGVSDFLTGGDPMTCFLIEGGDGAQEEGSLSGASLWSFFLNDRVNGWQKLFMKLGPGIGPNRGF